MLQRSGHLLRSFGAVRAMAQSAEASTAVNGITQKPEGPLYRVILDRPEVFNAFHIPMFHELAKALRTADSDSESKITVLSGRGKLFTAGNDLNNIGKVDSKAALEETADKLCAAVTDCFNAFIDHEKPLVCLVNGPGYGIGTTCLPLCDVVIAVDNAVFNTPFTPLGYSPEGCSTYTFNKLLGTSRAQDLLLFNRTITAKEALDWGLVARLVPKDQFEEETEKLLKSYSKLPKNSLRINKVMSRELEKEKLHQVHQREMKMLRERFLSEESLEATKRFLESRRKK
ncbi:unnamed protein product [Bursaphelenchus okinawaensis]|uniref:Uncharacterized protein n=1 Tax=Bursaphelenchus okinawaensis TaxID=465554 RepID=A0A811K1P0_9BILA|nr:unnamed protein product [Bursaphelenchus okinawaensis]CAG9089054.1 unnamed protein product [Bursaphelenchus okinawaensis]